MESVLCACRSTHLSRRNRVRAGLCLALNHSKRLLEATKAALGRELDATRALT